MKEKHKIGRRQLSIACILAGSCMAAGHAAMLHAAGVEPYSREQETLLVPEDKPWMAALAAPVAAHLRMGGPIPLVLSYSNPPTHELERLVSQAAAQQITVFAPLGQARLTLLLDEQRPERFDVGDGPAVASLRIAKRYWRQAKGVVLAMTDDAEGIILGSSVASAMDAPLLLVSPDESRLELVAALQSLFAQRAIVAVSDRRKVAPAARELPISSKLMLPPEMAHCVIDVVGVKNVHTVIVARFPEARAGVGRTAWLAPYMSAARGAPIVLARSSAAPVAEADVQHLIERENLQLRTITVLADYGSIGRNVITIEGEEGDENSPPQVAPPAPIPAPLQAQVPVAAAPALSASAAPLAPIGGTAPIVQPPPPIPKALVKTHYLFPIEPFMPHEPDKVAQWGVGRIPLESLSDASVLYARGLLRERILAGRAPRMLMVSNAGGSLPFCETICRVTADEYKNLGVHADEFYGTPSDSPDIMAAARDAQLIMYEGHTGAQHMIDIPVTRRSSPDVYGNDEEEELEIGDRPLPGGEAAAARYPSLIDGSSNGSSSSRDCPVPASSIAATPAPARSVMPIDPPSTRLQGPLNGMPIIMLQGCESLDEPILWRLDELGGVAVIGSVTAIHSGSGSAMAQALANSWLYRHSTLGEGLRDAENFMFCLEDMKRSRGHKQQSKGLRVALSFRLWGDPELAVFPALHRTPPKLPPVTATWGENDTLRIQIPQVRYPEEHANKFAAAMFPCSQSAGMVKAHENATQRDLMPVYYFRVPLPQDLAATEDLGIESSRATHHRVGLRIDRYGKALCVVYYPEKELPGEVIELHLSPIRSTARAAAEGATE